MSKTTRLAVIKSRNEITQDVTENNGKVRDYLVWKTIRWHGKTLPPPQPDKKKKRLNKKSGPKKGTKESI